VRSIKQTLEELKYKEKIYKGTIGDVVVWTGNKGESVIFFAQDEDEKMAVRDRLGRYTIHDIKEEVDTIEIILGRLGDGNEEAD